MARVMDFPSYQDMTECMAAAQQLQGRYHLTEANTHTETFLIGMRSDPRLINEMRSHNYNQAQKASKAAAWITEHLVFAAPRVLGLWLINKKCIETMKIEIMKPIYAAVTEAAVNRFNVESTTAADLRTYQTASTGFRGAVLGVLPFNAFRDIHPEVEHRMVVTRGVLGGLNDMLTSIVNKRNMRLGAEGAAPIRGNGAQHYEMYADYIADVEEDHALMNIAKRTKGNRGILMAQGELNETEEDGVTPKRGYLLLSTALKHHMTINNMTAADFAHDIRPMMIAALAEVATMNGGQEQQQVSDYSQQCANIDIIFNFYLTCRTTGIFEAAGAMSAIEWRKMKKINQGLFAIGQKMMSRDKVMEILVAAGGPLRALMNRVNQTGSQHMPPFACTCRRIYDFVAVFGMMKYSDLPRTFFSCAVSPRYFVHFKVTSEIAMSIIVYYWRCVEAMNETDNEIKNEAEHYFHQILINKISGYVNTTGKAGNVFNVTLHARQGVDPPRTVQPTIAEIIALARQPNQANAEDIEEAPNA